MELHEEGIYCPYCGEHQTILIDPTELGEEYIEDCQVCCRPIVFTIYGDEDNIIIEARHENDS